MRRYNVFYSWQSNISVNDAFIETCLTDATNLVQTESIKFTIDRDTLNERGTPDIPNSVFNKISNDVDIFISDITIVNKAEITNNQNPWLTPNSNVLLELGYAASSIGWENIICVINTAFGKPSELPFDIKFRKPIEFYLPLTHSKDETDSAKDILTNEFHKTILSLNPSEKKYRLREITNILISDDWMSIGATSTSDASWGKLRITHEINNVFQFQFESYTNVGDGDWTGQLYLNPNFYYSGKINWELNNKSNYGLKEFFIAEDTDHFYLYLVPINVEVGEHGREVLKRRK